MQAEYCFGRYRWRPLPFHNPLDLWDRLACRLPGDGFERVRCELANGLENMELAFAAWRLKKLPPLGELHGVDPVFFERLSLEGHNLHPGAKTRLSFSPEDSQNYAAELGGEFDLGFVGVRRDFFEQSGEPLERWFKVDLPEGYRPIPVHPFQRRRVLRELYDEEWEAGILVDSPTRIPVRACTSLRTVAPLDRGLPALKLSVDIQTTSTVRSMSPQTVINGPLFSKLLSESAHPPGFVTLSEIGGARLQVKGAHRGRNLCALMRTRLRPEKDEMAVVASSFTSPYPTPKGAASSLLGQIVALGDDGPRAFWQDYVRLLLEGHLELLQRVGLGLEAHLQNCVVGFVRGRPRRLYVRDWGGLRAFEPRLLKHYPDLRLAPDSMTVSGDLETVLKKFSYCLFQNHLAEVARILAEEYGLSEKWMWARVRSQLEASLDEGSLERAFLTRPTLPHKALLKMRLEGSGSDLYEELPNPMAVARRAARPTNPSP
ncbi:MAG: IucA/IucC family protein [Acidobacteriota bacterium]